MTRKESLKLALSSFELLEKTLNKKIDIVENKLKTVKNQDYLSGLIEGLKEALVSVNGAINIIKETI